MHSHPKGHDSNLPALEDLARLRGIPNAWAYSYGGDRAGLAVVAPRQIVHRSLRDAVGITHPFTSKVQKGRLTGVISRDAAQLVMIGIDRIVGAPSVELGRFPLSDVVLASVDAALDKHRDRRSDPLTPAAHLRLRALVRGVYTELPPMYVHQVNHPTEREGSGPVTADELLRATSAVQMTGAALGALPDGPAKEGLYDTLCASRPAAGTARASLASTPRPAARQRARDAGARRARPLKPELPGSRTLSAAACSPTTKTSC
jgi:hypothetical protein